jgi:iron complex transport system ATP-binding protein
VPAALLQTEKLNVAVPGRVLIEGLECEIGGGDFVALLGGNGAGKSLLLRTLAGLRAPAEGRVLLGGAPMETMSRREVARRLGFLPQDPESTPQGAVAESVLLGRFAHLGFWEPSGAADLGRVERALDQVGIAGLAARALGSLSGGEQRRAAIARLLCQAPSVYLLDEPTNHLDPAQQIGVLQAMRALSREGAAVVVSLHDPNLALRFADRIALLDGQGTVALVDTKDLDAEHLGRLYGLRYAETRLGGQRLMAPV